jgi:hypothetical protein
LYVKEAISKFAGQMHWCVAFDPGLHGGKDYCVSAIYALDLNMGAYGVPQVLQCPPKSSICHPDVIGHIQTGGKIERRSALTEIIALDHSLWQACRATLADAKPWHNCVLRPLHAHEVRISIPDTKLHAVVNTQTQHCTPELDCRACGTSTFALIADQGSIGTAGLHFLVNFLGYFLVLLPDPNHRIWNDIKTACQRATRFWWKTLVSLTLVFNLNYGPFGKGHWFDKKKAFFEDWKDKASVNDALFQKYAPRIAEDNDLPAPETPEQFHHLLELVKCMKSFVQKGPLVKMMRWFSWWVSAEFYKKELHAVKMILEAFMLDHGDVGEDDVSLRDPVAPNANEKHTKESAQAELNALKKQHGSWYTAFHCITEENRWNMRALLRAVSPLWTTHTWRVENVKTPELVLKYAEFMAAGGWQRELVKLVNETLHDRVCLQSLGIFIDFLLSKSI